MISNLFDLAGKTALITGGSSGLGKRFAYILSEAGAKVIIAARRMKELQIVADELRSRGKTAIPVELNVNNKHAIKSLIHRLVEKGERIDILINNAGIAGATPIFDDEEHDKFEEIMQTNLIGVWYMTRMVAKHMKQFNISGSIINIASVLGSASPSFNSSAYSVSKAAVIQLTKQLVGSLAVNNIRINTILPGLVYTNLSRERIERDKEQLTREIPLGFIANDNDLDGVVLLLASNAASRYMTGSCIVIDGGKSWGGKIIHPNSPQGA